MGGESIKQKEYIDIYRYNKEITKEDVLYGIHHSWNVSDIKVFLRGIYKSCLQATIRGDFYFWLEILNRNFSEPF